MIRLIAFASLTTLFSCNTIKSETAASNYYTHVCYETDGTDYTKIPFKEYKKVSYPTLTFIVDGAILNKDNILGYYEDIVCKILYIKYDYTDNYFQVTKYVNTSYEVRFIGIGAKE